MTPGVYEAPEMCFHAPMAASKTIPFKHATAARAAVLLAPSAVIAHPPGQAAPSSPTASTPR